MAWYTVNFSGTHFLLDLCWFTVPDPGGEGAMTHPTPVEISHKKDGLQRWPPRFHFSHPPFTQPLDPLLFHQIDPLSQEL